MLTFISFSLLMRLLVINKKNCMKKIVYILLTLFLFSSCNVAKSYLKRGDFDGAVKVAAQKLMRNKNKKVTLEVLIEAYPKAVTKDFDQVKYLHQQGRPDRWEPIFLIYDNMKERQTLVENLYPLFFNGKPIKFDHYDFDQQIIEAKAKAADYFYNNAKKLMQQKTKIAYRQAFNEFLKVQTYSTAYLDADQLMDECYQQGQAHLLLIAVNNTPFKLKNDFMINLIAFNSKDLDGFWHKYYSTDVRKGNYDGFIYVTISKIDVSPNNKSVREFTESTEITEGWEYKLDSLGKVMKDTAGNPIQIPKKKLVSCKVIETKQFKQAHLEGFVQFSDAKSKQVLLSVPIVADNIFENYFYTTQGDQRALKNETKAKLDNKPLQYPLDIDMIYNANQTLKSVIFNVLRDKRTFVENNF